MKLKENANKYSSGRGALIKKNGFTLIEVISVIIIIGILAIITVPAVSDYILGARQTTYTSHEKSMEEAANSMLIDCIDKNSNECNIPEKGEKSLIYLRELIDNGYIDRLSSSNGQGYCDDTLSYVEIENTGKSNYEYKACLYCGDYITETEGCTKYENDGDKPVCGTVTGEKTEWTNKNVTILVGCSDATSGCLRDTFSKTFTETTKEGTIEIADKSGNAIDCPVNVYVDKDKPTCQLEVVSGTLEATGWYSGDVKVKLTGYTDTGSGVLTYGIGTSINNRNYNRETVIDLKTGITTVIGYVKDYAGNEGICSLDVKVGASKPTFEIEYGYQIYPNKETYTLTNMTESGTVLTTTTPDPMISFTGLGEYRNVNRVVVYLNNAITTTTTGQVFYSNGEHSEANSTRALMIAGQKEVEFVIPRGTYENIRIDLGEISGTNYDIKRIELRVGDRSNLYTNKNVTINIMPTNESVKTTEFSFDNGETWQSSNTKEVASNYTGKAVTRNNLPLTSIPVDISVGNIDKEIPSCTLKAEGIKSTSEYFGGNVTISFASAMDAIANSNYASSGIKNYGIGSPSGSKSTIMTEENTTGVTYTGKVEDKAGNVGTCSIVVKKKANFTLTYNNNNGTGCSSKTITYNNAYGTLCTPTRAGYSFAGWYTAASGGTQVTSSTKLTTGQNQTIYAHWTANNYTLTYNNNGGSGCSSKTITYGSTYGTLCTPSRSGYTFLGWYTAANGGTQVTSSTALWSTSNQTIYAHWKLNSYTITFNGNGNTGGSTASKTCTPGAACVLTANGFTKTNYAFAGWSKTQGGAVVYANGQTVYETSNLTLYAVWVQSVTNFGYTGGVQTYTAPYTGSYKLEVWGAQGEGAGSCSGGAGGYSTGYVWLTAGQKVYVVVGGQSSYNGGGIGNDTGDTQFGAGGGATHIATTNRGILKNYSSYKAEILIVAGGGGGAGNYNGTCSAGGTGGGTQGGVGEYKKGTCSGTIAGGGTQTSGGINSESGHSNALDGGFGYGGYFATYGSGGGGGYYGGGASRCFGSGGSGGSGYIGGVTSGSMQNGARSGNGYARITYVSN